MRNKKLLRHLAILTLSVAATGSLTLFGCTHKHTYSEEWKYDDASGHYHQSTCKHDTKSELEAHQYTDDTDATCDVCGYTREIKKPDPPAPAQHEHVYSEFKSDDNKHWKECTAIGCTDSSGTKYSEGYHSWADSTEQGKEKCSVCGSERNKVVATVSTLFSLNSDTLAQATFSADAPINWDEGGLVKLYSVATKAWSYDASESAKGEVKDASGTVVKTTDGRLKSNGSGPYIVINLKDYLGDAKITLSFAPNAEGERSITFTEENASTPIYTETTTDKSARFITKLLKGGKEYKISFSGSAYNFYGIVLEYNEGEFGLNTADEALATKKAEAKAALDAYKNASEYIKNAATLAAEIQKGKAAIDNAFNESAVNQELAKAKAEIDKIKTDAQIAADEAGALATAKSTAKSTLTNYKTTEIAAIDASLNAQLLENIAAKKTAGATAIDDATTVTGVESALNAAKLEVDNLLATTRSLADLQNEVKATLTEYSTTKKGEVTGTSAEAKINEVVEKYNNVTSGVFFAEGVTNANIYTKLENAKAEIDDIVLWEKAPDDFIVAKNPDKTLVRLDKDKAVDSKLAIKANNDTAGIYMLSQNVDSNYTEEYVKVIDDGGFKAYSQVGTGVKDKPNIYTDIVLGQTKGKIEGFFEFKLSKLVGATSTSSQTPIQFSNGLQIVERKNGQLSYIVGSAAEVPISTVTLTANTYAKVHFVYEDGKMTLAINDIEVIKNVEVSAPEYIRLSSSDKGGRQVTARRIIVVGTALTLAEKIDVKLAQLKAAYDNYGTETESVKYDDDGKAELSAAYNDGKTKLEALKTAADATLEKMTTEYSNAINAMKAVKTIEQKQKEQDEQDLADYKTAAINAIDAKRPDPEIDETNPDKQSIEARIKELKDAAKAAINAVAITAEVDLTAAETAIDTEKDKCLYDLDEYFGDLSQAISDLIEEKQAALDDYVNDEIDNIFMTLELEQTDEEIVRGVVTQAVAEVVTAQKATLVGAANATELATKVTAAEGEILKAINAEFAKNKTITVTYGTTSHTMSVKFATMLTVDMLHITAYEVLSATYGEEDTAIPENGVLITADLSVTITEVDEIEGFKPKETFTVSADKIVNNAETSVKPTGSTETTIKIEDNLLFDIVVSANAKYSNVKIGGQDYSIRQDVPAPTVADKKVTEVGKSENIVFNIKADLTKLDLSLYLSDKAGTGSRTGNLKYQINNNDSVSKDINKLLTIPNLKAGDIVTVHVENTSLKSDGSANGGSLFIAKVEGTLDETNVLKNRVVTWQNNGENGAVIDTKQFHYYDAICPKLTPTRAATDLGEFIGWVREGDTEVYNTGDILPEGTYTLKPKYVYNIVVTCMDGENEVEKLYLYTTQADMLVTGLPNCSQGTQKHIGWTKDGNDFDDETTKLARGTIETPAEYTLVAKFETVEAVATVVVSGTNTVEKAKTITLSATVTGTEGTVFTDREITWAVSDTNKATITSAGVLTGLAEGSVTITATAGGITSEAFTVTITAPSFVAETESIYPGAISRSANAVLNITDKKLATISSTMKYANNATGSNGETANKAVDGKNITRTGEIDKFTTIGIASDSIKGSSTATAEKDVLKITAKKKIKVTIWLNSSSGKYESAKKVVITAKDKSGNAVNSDGTETPISVTIGENLDTAYKVEFTMEEGAEYTLVGTAGNVTAYVGIFAIDMVTVE